MILGVKMLNINYLLILTSYKLYILFIQFYFDMLNNVIKKYKYDLFLRRNSNEHIIFWRTCRWF